jgi:hypothetical protein
MRGDPRDGMRQNSKSRALGTSALLRRVPGKLFRILVQEIAHFWCLVTSSIQVMGQGQQRQFATESSARIMLVM